MARAAPFAWMARSKINYRNTPNFYGVLLGYAGRRYFVGQCNAAQCRQESSGKRSNKTMHGLFLHTTEAPPIAKMSSTAVGSRNISAYPHQS
jgi:hypothetical protein